jgi:hypothetical protein
MKLISRSLITFFSKILKNLFFCLVWWCTRIRQALKRLKQEDCEHRPTWVAQGDPVSTITATKKIHHFS